MARPTTSWKAFESRIAKLFGGKRRGAYTGSNGQGMTDVIHETWAIECKLLGAPGWAQMLAAAKQAEANAEPGQEPVAIIKRKNARDEDALVVQRLGVFADHRLGGEGDE